jgi:hypothetical protein
VKKSMEISGDALPEARKLEFALEAFGGSLHDEPAVLERIEETVRKVAERDRTAGTILDRACG